MQTEEANDRFLEIDGVRGLGAIYVILIHANSFLNNAKGHDWLVDHASYLIPVFFFLSGFLLFRITDKRLHEKYWRGNFYIRRAFRILPLWYALLFLQVVIVGVKWDELLANITFLFGFFGGDGSSRFVLNYSAWSLFVEESFYLFFH